jgi:hypothetical protein
MSHQEAAANAAPSERKVFVVASVDGTSMAVRALAGGLRARARAHSAPSSPSITVDPGPLVKAYRLDRKAQRRKGTRRVYAA